ncbi:hypothetical protein V3481_004069 [Fusarium oxysporum f. sp. vasinfectum]
MVAIRSFFILSAAVSIASAGKCKPESRSSSVVSVPSSTASASDAASSTASASATLIESSTTLADTTVETSLTESATETASSATSAGATKASTTESKPTTFLTSITTSNADTTKPAATTTSAAHGPVVNCPSEVDQCLGTIEIQCDVILSGLEGPTTVADLNECAQQCNSDTSCVAFTYSEGLQTCFKVTASQSYTAVNLSGWVSGIKGTCSQNTEPSSTAFTSTAEITTTEAATTTTTLAPADPTCPSTVEQCAGDSACASFCNEDDTCAGFSCVRSNGACFKAITLIVGVTQSDKAGWDSGIKGTCGQQLQPTTTAFTSTAEIITTEAATTTTVAVPVNNCPSETGQCIDGGIIQCDVALGNLSPLRLTINIADCSRICADDSGCQGFSFNRETRECFGVYSDPDDVTQHVQEGWVSGIKNTCVT